MEEVSNHNTAAAVPACGEDKQAPPMQIDLTPTWGEMGFLFMRMALTGQTAVLRKLQPELAKAMAAAEALKTITPSLTDEQNAVVRTVMAAEIAKQTR